MGTQYDFFFRDMIRNHGRERKKSLEEELKKLESQTNAEVLQKVEETVWKGN